MADNMARQSITLAMQITERAASIVATEVNAVTNLLQAVADYDNSAEKLLEYQKEGYGKLNYNLCDKAYSGDFEQKLKNSGINATVSKTPVDICGGFILRCGDIEENMEFTAIIAANRDRIDDLINRELFAE